MYKIGSGEAEDVLALGDFNELIWQVVSGVAVLSSRAQLDVEATNGVVAHPESKAVFLGCLFY